MPVTIGSNIFSLRAQRSLSDATGELSRTYERLSSGQRINRASDDAAGLAISDSLRANAQIYSQSIRNLNDGVSVLSIATGATNELTSMLTRMKELAEQSANGTFSNGQRSSLDNEAQALAKEFNRIIATTKFNGKSLLSSTDSSIRLQLGDSSANGGIFVRTGNLGVGRRGDGTFVSSGSLTTVGGGGEAVDVNGDGILDLLSASGQNVQVSFGNGDGTFQAASSQRILTSSQNGSRTGDFNGDGKVDIIVGTVSGVTFVSYGNGDGTFSFGQSFSGSGSLSAEYNSAVGDVNNDGIDDFLSEGKIFFGRTSGTLQADATYFGSSGTALGDINGDGKLDLVHTDGNSIFVSLGNGNGTFQGNSTIALSGGSAEAFQLRIGDINGDGKADILWSDTSYGDVFSILGNGNGTFASANPLGLPDGVSLNSFTSKGLQLKDLNGDGRDDLFYTDVNIGDPTIMLANSDGSFGAATKLSTNSAVYLIAGDFNGDGAVDLLGLNGSATGTRLYTANTQDTSELDEFSLKTRNGALAAIGLLEQSFQRLSKARSLLGSDESRINFAKQVVGIMRENYLAAESRIKDADVADETSKLIRYQILQKAGASILAQANQQPAIALSLLS